MAAGRSRCCGCSGWNARCSGCSCAASSTPCVSCHLLANGRCFNPFNPVDADSETDANNSLAARCSPAGSNVAPGLNAAPLIQAASSLSQASSPSDSSAGQLSLPSTLASRNSSAPAAEQLLRAILQLQTQKQLLQGLLNPPLPLLLSPLALHIFPSVLEVPLYLPWHILWIYRCQYSDMFLKEPECKG